MHFFVRAFFIVVKPIFLRRIQHPERVISVIFREFSPVSEQFIETAMRCAFDATEPTPAAIISNFCQGAVLFGIHNTDMLEWRLFPERAIITKESAHLPHAIKQHLRKSAFEIRFNSSFDEVVRKCTRESYSWITDPLVQLYKKLFEEGFCWSIEAYHQEALCGGIWGIAVGGVFSAQSMFHSVDNAGSVTMGVMVEKVLNGEIPVLDWGTPHARFARYGAMPVSRAEFVKKVAQHLNQSPARLDSELGHNTEIEIHLPSHHLRRTVNVTRA